MRWQWLILKQIDYTVGLEGEHMQGGTNHDKSALSQFVIPAIQRNKDVVLIMEVQLSQHRFLAVCEKTSPIIRQNCRGVKAIARACIVCS